jgi:hypothetical protein
MNKLIINQDVLLRTPITQLRMLCVVFVRYMKEKETNCSNKAQHVPHQGNIFYLNPRT